MKRRRKLWRKEVASNASQSRQVFLGELFQFHVFHWRCILILLQRSNVPVFFLSFCFCSPGPVCCERGGCSLRMCLLSRTIPSYLSPSRSSGFFEGTMGAVTALLGHCRFSRGNNSNRRESIFPVVVVSIVVDVVFDEF